MRSLFYANLPETGRVTFALPIEAVEFVIIVIAIKVFINHVLHLLAELPACRRRLFKQPSFLA